MTMSILELLQHIVNEPAPRLTPEGRFPKEADDFVDSCLLKDPDARKTPKDLLVSLICKLQLKIFEKPPSSSLLRPEFLPVCFILIYVILVTKQSHLRLFCTLIIETPVDSQVPPIINRPRNLGFNVLNWSQYMFSSTFKRTFSEASYIRSTSQDRFLPFHQIISLLFCCRLRWTFQPHISLVQLHRHLRPQCFFLCLSKYPTISSLASFSSNPPLLTEIQQI